MIEQLGVSQELVSVLYYNFSNPHQLYLDVLKLVFWSDLNFFSQNSGCLLNSSWLVFFLLLISFSVQAFTFYLGLTSA